MCSRTRYGPTASGLSLRTRHVFFPAKVRKGCLEHTRVSLGCSWGLSMQSNHRVLSQVQRVVRVVRYTQRCSVRSTKYGTTTVQTAASVRPQLQIEPTHPRPVVYLCTHVLYVLHTALQCRFLWGGIVMSVAGFRSPALVGVFDIKRPGPLAVQVLQDVPRLAVK